MDRAQGGSKIIFSFLFNIFSRRFQSHSHNHNYRVSPNACHVGSIGRQLGHPIFLYLLLASIQKSIMCWHTLIGCIYIYIYIYFLISYWLYIQLYHRSNRNIIEINIPFKRKCLFQYFVLYSLIRMEYRRDTKKEGFSQSCTLYHAICIAHIDFKLPLQTVFYFIFWQKEFRTSILNDSFLSLNENIN